MKSICIIPIYNEYDKLNKLFSKIKKNKHKNFGLTYLAINNGSSDQSLNLIKKHKIKLNSTMTAYIKAEENARKEYKITQKQPLYMLPKKIQNDLALPRNNEF